MRTALTTKPESTQSFTPTRSSLLQRKCACGNSAGLTGECSECQNKQLTLQRRATNSAKRTDAPAIVHEVLNSPGQSLEPDIRTLMEARFGQDFSQVRVHTNDQAQQSARAVNALAYTVGSNIVFGAGQYSSHTFAGQKILAHELTHTLQQSSISNPAIAPLKVGSSDDFYEREAEALAEKVVSTNEATVLPTQQSAPSIQRLGDLSKVPSGLPCPVASDSATSVTDYVTFDNRAATLSDIQKAQIDNFVRNWWAVGGTPQVRLDGFASQVGSDELNWRLSCDRALAVAAELMHPSSGEPGIPGSFISIFAQGETNEFGTDAENRRVNIFTTIPSPPPPPPPPPSPYVCGPDVTSQIVAAIGNTRSTFRGWSNSDKASTCNALISLSTGGYAWDIVELHNNAWILSYRPACATQGATPPCGSTVQVDHDCYYAGSPNYVIFGVMCELCNTHFNTIGDTSSANEFTEAEMLYWINFYKGTGPLGLSTPSANFGSSRDWAVAGFRGWPGATAPSGDRNNCAPTCPTAYSGSRFYVNWVPKGVF